MYVITEWHRRYEVNQDGRPAKKGDKVRCSRLDFVRLNVFGRRQGTGYRKLGEIAGERLLEVFGLFAKLLEIAADQPYDLRGAILNEEDEPATDRDIAFMVGAPLEKTQTALADLRTVKWVACDECDGSKEEITRIVAEFSEVRGRPRKQNNNNPQVVENNEVKGNSSDTLADSRGFPQPFKNRTKPNETEHNSTKQNETSTREQEGQNQDGEAPEAESVNSTISNSVSLSNRLDFLNSLRGLLKATSVADVKAVGNFERWLSTNKSDMSEKVLEIAKESQNGRKPIAVFFSRIGDELGYRPAAEKDKRK